MFVKDSTTTTEYLMYTKHRQEPRHARKACSGTLADPTHAFSLVETQEARLIYPRYTACGGQGSHHKNIFKTFYDQHVLHGENYVFKTVIRK